MVSRRLALFHCALISIFALAFPSHADADWVPLGPDGGRAEGLLIDAADPDRLLLLSQTAGLFESTDGASTFAPLAGTPRGEGFGSAIRIGTIVQNPVAPDFIVAVGQFGTQRGWRSTDGGRNWTEIDTVELVGDIAFNSDGSRAYGTTGDGLVLSLDNGLTWDPLPLTGAPPAFGSGSRSRIFTSPALPDRVYLVNSGQMIRSENGGTSWQPLATLPSGFSVNDFAVVDDAGETLLAVSTASEGEIFASADNGASWGIETSGLIDPLGDPAEVDALGLQRTTGAIFALSEGRLHRSDGIGQPWSSSNLPTNLDLADELQFHPQDSARMFITASSGLFGSADGGSTWQPMINGFRGHVITELSTSRAAPDTVLADTSFTAFSTSDSGSTWAGIGPSTLLDDTVFKPIASATDPMTLDAVSVLNTPMRSTNGGASWTLLPSPSDAPNQVGVGLTLLVWSDPRDDSTLVAGEWGPPSIFGIVGMYQSIDGGGSWTRRFAPPPDRLIFQPNSLADDPTRPGTVFFGIHSRTEQAFTDGLVLRSTDGGATFDNLIDGFAFAEVAVDSAGTVFAAGTNLSIRQGIWRSTDGGDSWEAVSNGIPLPTSIIDIDAHPTIPGRAVLSTLTDLYETRDNGTSWQRMSRSGLGRGNVIRSIEILPGTGEQLELMAGTDSGVFYSNRASLRPSIPVPILGLGSLTILALLALLLGLLALTSQPGQHKRIEGKVK